MGTEFILLDIGSNVGFSQRRFSLRCESKRRVKYEIFR